MRRLTSLLATALLVGTAGAPVFTQSAHAFTTGDTVDLRVLLVGTTGGATDPTTAAWAAGLASQGVAYTEVDATGALGAQTIALPALTSSATHGLFNAVVVAGKPGDFAAGQLDPLSAYESTFGIRQIDGNFVPPAGGILGLSPPGTDASSGAGISGTTPVLTAAGLFTFPALAGPVAIDTGTFGAPGAVQTSLPTGASETPLLTDAAGNALIGVYVHPPTGDTQPNVAEMTIGFNYNLNMTQWLMLGPGLIDWVTGGAHLGLYRNYSIIHVDDIFTPDDTWNTTTHANDYDPAAALRMRPVDVDTEATWSRTHNYRLDNLFNGGSSPTNSITAPAADPLLAEFQKNDPATGKPYTQDFGWLNHTWDHAYLDVGCATTNYIEAEVQQNTNWAASAPGATPGTGGLGLVNSADNSLSLGTQNPTTLVPGGHSGFANLLLGPNDAVDPPNLDDEVVNLTGGTLATGSYQWALTDQFNGADPTNIDESSASVTTPIAVTLGQTVTLSWGGVCHAANYRVYREVAGTNVWSLVGSVTPGMSATPPATVTADPTGGSTTNTAGGGMQVQSFTDTGAAGTLVNGWTPPTLENAHEMPWQQNANFLTAMQALNMTSVGTDASKPYPNPATTAFGIGVNYTGATFPVNAAFPDGTFEGVPRHPINIFYNNSTERQAVDEYNTIYVDSAHGGKCVNTSTTTCLTTAATFSSIVASVETGMFSNMIHNDPRPTYVHQTNIMGTAPATIPATPPNTSTAIGDGLLYSVLNPLLAKYHSAYTASAPIQQPTMGALGTILNEQSAWAAVQPAGTASSANSVSASQTDGNIVVTNNGATAVTVPVSTPLGYTLAGQPFGMQYGGTLSAWETLAPGASITISAAPPAITSAATASAEVGAPFTFTVTTTGGQPVTVAETGALPNGLTFTPGVIAGTPTGTATITGTPAAGTGGTYPITFNATNVTGPPGATQAFSLFVAEPKLTIAPSTNPPSFAAAGTPITANYLVTNTGNVDLTTVGVTDPLAGISPVSCPSTTLAVGASETCTALYAATQLDVDSGGITSTPTASGTAPSSTVVHASAGYTTPARQAPAIAVTPSAAPGSFFGAGTPLAFSYLVTNSGNVTLHDIGVTDPLAGPSAISCPGTPLAPAATQTCTGGPYVTTAADVSAKGVTDTPIATGTTPAASKVTGSFHFVVPFWVKPQITNAKLTTVPRQTNVNTNFTATGIPAPTLTLSGKLPKGLTFKTGNGTAKLSGTVNAAGNYPLTLTATSPAGSTHKTYLLHVTAPQLASQVAAQPGNQKATVKWVPPALHGGLPVTGYVVTPYLGHHALKAHTFHSTAKHQVITGLANGRSYTFKVAVMNRLGTGPNALTGKQIGALGLGHTSTASPPIKIGAPTAPATVTVGATGPGAVTVTFSGSGGNTTPVTHYTAICSSQNGGATQTAIGNGTVRSINITGLTSHKSYKCSVYATNNTGAGPSKTSTRFFAP